MKQNFDISLIPITKGECEIVPDDVVNYDSLEECIIRKNYNKSKNNTKLECNDSSCYLGYLCGQKKMSPIELYETAENNRTHM